ncbi:MAG: hydroxysqualene dehydroxylase HpnE [Gemmata sp.]|nr:hydroxysqualene dehydroxylase HpnE [Gemmata sp.]
MHSSGLATPTSAVVIGGGLAGIAAAVGLAQHGVRVTLVEARNRLGGRAGSFTDPASGQWVDACQHVSMGCCTNFSHLLRTIGLEHFLSPQTKLYFITPDRRRSVFKADPWPAPLHLGRALWGAHYLTETDKLRIAWGLFALLRAKPQADPPLLPWLEAHWQNRRTIDRFWAVVLTSALNETIDRIGLKYARKVFRDGFLRHRDGFVVHIPTVPLGRLYGDELRTWLAAHQVHVREGIAVKRLHILARETSTAGMTSLPPDKSWTVQRVELRDGSTLSADWYVLAVPFDRVGDVIPAEVMEQETYFANIRHLSPSPITSVHLWFDQPVLTLPHAVLIDSCGQWVFNRGEVAPGEFYVQVVVSAARELRGAGRAEIQRRIVDELQRLFPPVARARLLRAKVVTEHTATFSAVPGVDRWRPAQASPIANLAVAGDWTNTGWPATMEGAVRSGYLAAEVILARRGQPVKLLQPELGEL